MDCKKDMKSYRVLHDIDSHTNYKFCDKGRGNREDCEALARFFHQNYSKMETVELKQFLSRIMSDARIRKEILEFEFQNLVLEPVEHMDLKEFVGEAQRLIQRYQNKAGGFFLEDAEWIVHDDSSIENNVFENEILLVNSISKSDGDEDETNDYLDRLEDILNSLAKNIEVDIRFEEVKEDSIIWVRLWCIDTENLKTKTNDIRL